MPYSISLAGTINPAACNLNTRQGSPLVLVRMPGARRRARPRTPDHIMKKGLGHEIKDVGFKRFKGSRFKHLGFRAQGRHAFKLCVSGSGCRTWCLGFRSHRRVLMTTTRSPEVTFLPRH